AVPDVQRNLGIEARSVDLVDAVEKGPLLDEGFGVGVVEILDQHRLGVGIDRKSGHDLPSRPHLWNDRTFSTAFCSACAGVSDLGHVVVEMGDLESVGDWFARDGSAAVGSVVACLGAG